MDDLLACRICLIMDVRMYNLRSSPLDIYFKTIFGVHPKNHELLSYVCVECAVLIKKFYMFREKCVQGIQILQDILSKNGQILKKDIKSIDRHHLRLSSTINLGTMRSCYYYHLSSKPELCSVFLQEPSISEPETLKPTKVLVKKETPNKIYERDHDYDTVSYFDDNVSSVEDNKLNDQQTISEQNIDENQKPIENTIKSVENQKSENVPLIVKRRRAKAGNNTELDVKPLPPKSILDFFDVIACTLEEQKKEIQDRQHTDKYKKAIFKCTKCFRISLTKEAYENHEIKHDPSLGPLECQLCGFRFRMQRQLGKHLMRHSERYACRMCPRIIRSRAQAVQHKAWHKGTTFQCKQCFETFSHRSTYMSHLRLKHPSQHICNLCGHSFLSELGRKVHRTSMHKTVGEVELTGPTCEKCDIQFLNQQAYDRHLVKSANHITESIHNPTMCRQCGVSFENKTEMLNHRKEHFRVQYVKTFKPNSQDKTVWPKKCNYCEEMIPNPRENWSHHGREHRDLEYNHTSKRLCICEICGHMALSRTHLNYHMSDKHLAERPHECQHCGKTFGTVTKYKLHVRTHSDERPYSCRFCSWSFKSKGYLLNHEKTHSGLRPFACKICGKTFASSTSRGCHVKYVHQKAPPPLRKNRGLKRKKAEDDVTPINEALFIT